MTWVFFTPYEADIVKEATVRLAPGPDDEPDEHGHPGAREANVVRYIDNLLGGLAADPPPIYATGTTKSGPPGGFLPLTAPQRVGWEHRIARWRDLYRQGIRALDQADAGGFLATPASTRDELLLRPEHREFRTTLFGHTVEAMYSDPVYGGNDQGRCWQEICYTLPSSFTAPAPADWVGWPPPREPTVEPLLEKLLPQAIQLLLDPEAADA